SLSSSPVELLQLGPPSGSANERITEPIPPTRFGDARGGAVTQPVTCAGVVYLGPAAQRALFSRAGNLRAAHLRTGAFFRAQFSGMGPKTQRNQIPLSGFTRVVTPYLGVDPMDTELRTLMNARVNKTRDLIETTNHEVAELRGVIQST